jgi:F0F1-type ATP synthase membrane subunit b/b'
MKKWLPLPLLLLVPAAWLAASTGGGTAHAIDWFGVLARVFNSTVLFGGLILLLRKPLIQMLSQKRAAIQADIVEREKELAAAEQRLRDIGERLSRVADEVERIQGGAETAGKLELSRLEEAGRLEAERIIAMSDAEIRQRVDAAVRAVKGRIADLAIERFEEDFKKGLDASTQQKIIERNIDACGGLDEGK